jgi:hypothetical protein
MVNLQVSQLLEASERERGRVPLGHATTQR